MQGIPFVSEQLHEGELVHSLEIARWDRSSLRKDPKVGARMLNAMILTRAAHDALGHSRPDAGHHPHEPAGS